MADPVLTTEERDTLAGELALGVLEGEDRARALRLQLADPVFAAEVRGWAERLAPLHAGFGETAAPEGLWARIEARLSNGGDVLLRRRLRRWRGGALLSGAIAAGLALVLLLDTRAPAPLVVAQLAGDTPGTLVTAAYDPASGALRLRAAMPGDALAPELWVIPADGVPRSLGLIAENGTTNLPVAVGHRALIADGATLAVTMEPRTGAPHAAPSSAPVASGKITTI
jgi:anti-sigma-K factor RskA